MKTRIKKWSPKFIALVLVCLLIGAGIGLMAYHFTIKPITPNDWQSKKPNQEVMMNDITHLTTQSGEYFTIDKKKSNLLLIDSHLDYYSLEQNDRGNDIWFDDVANVSDTGIVITGIIKNEYDKDYYISMSAKAFNSEGETIGWNTDWGPIYGVICIYVESGQTEDFELHLKYYEKYIENIDITVGLSEIPLP